MLLRAMGDWSPPVSRTDTCVRLHPAGGERHTAHEHHLVHVALVNAAVADALAHRPHEVPEGARAQLNEADAREGARVPDTIDQGVNLNRRLRGGRKRTPRALALRAQAPDGAQTARDVLAMVSAPEILHAPLHDAVIEAFAAELRAARHGLRLEVAALYRQQGHIENAAAHVADQHVHGRAADMAVLRAPAVGLLLADVLRTHGLDLRAVARQRDRGLGEGRQQCRGHMRGGLPRRANALGDQIVLPHTALVQDVRRT
mmetsp:Transcript_17610/g.49567  ORF Transcript_17610/g.49567 Transcript_17610/m.49567 type:complete len:259 (+) Transcript_17610:404-1180(+)